MGLGRPVSAARVSRSEPLRPEPARLLALAQLHVALDRGPQLAVVLGGLLDHAQLGADRVEPHRAVERLVTREPQSVDAPRVAPGADTRILRSLEAHGLTWDGPVVRQSQHIDLYRDALAELTAYCYACRCSRRDLRGRAAYPGTCRRLRLPRQGNALRVRAPVTPIVFEDRIQGARSENLATTRGDFVVWRRDGFASYQLAVVVDDDAMDINAVVRGADLLDNTPRQLYLLQRLGRPAPHYAHVPVVVEATGVKLSKHNAATAIDDRGARHNVATVLGLLGLNPPWGRVDAMLDWARLRWEIGALPAEAVIPGFTALA